MGAWRDMKKGKKWVCESRKEGGALGRPANIAGGLYYLCITFS